MPRDKKTLNNPLNEDLPELTEKERSFVEGLLEGKTASDAYRAAYDTETDRQETVWTSASMLKNSPKVRRWLAAAKHAYLSKAAYTHEQYIQDIENDIEEAKRAGNYGAAATLRGLLGKANAFLTDVSIRKDERSSLSDEIKKLAAVNPNMAQIMAAQLGITSKPIEDAIEIESEKD